MHTYLRMGSYILSDFWRGVDLPSFIACHRPGLWAPKADSETAAQGSSHTTPGDRQLGQVWGWRSAENSSSSHSSGSHRLSWASKLGEFSSLGIWSMGLINHVSWQNLDFFLAQKLWEGFSLAQKTASVTGTTALRPSEQALRHVMSSVQVTQQVKSITWGELRDTEVRVSLAWLGS